MKYDEYIHINGDLIVKAKPFEESFIDQSSPFVTRYFPPVEAESIDDARQMFLEALDGK